MNTIITYLLSFWPFRTKTASAAPVTFTTASAHGFRSGDVIRITGYEGEMKVTAVKTTTFRIRRLYWFDHLWFRLQAKMREMENYSSHEAARSEDDAKLD